MSGPGPARGPWLGAGFWASWAARPQAEALRVAGAGHSYQELGGWALGVARLLAEAGDPNALVGLLGARGLGSFAGILGILAAGRGYVPLNPAFPVERSLNMLAQAGCASLVADPACGPVLEQLLEQAPAPLNCLFPLAPVGRDLEELRRRFPWHVFLAPDSAEPPAPASPPAPPVVDPGAVAYLMFTSGSTGVPKGVPISHANATAYVDQVIRLYGVGPTDRHSQNFELTFDLSVHDLFVTWGAGASLCVPPAHSAFAPARFINQERLTIWFSVPSVIMFLARMRLLRPGALPGLRLSLFCGEPLPAAWADQWLAAAPRGRLENLYGPTEATIAITRYPWAPADQGRDCPGGVVPIGWPFSGQRALVVDQDDRPAPGGQAGELCLGGGQVAAGYLDRPELSASRFTELPACGPGVWYRTGDLARRGADGCLYYLGRLDQQVQVRGHRVELQEVEHHLRQALDGGAVACLPWPADGAGAQCLYGLAVGLAPGAEAEVLEHCRRHLPEYMVPHRVFPLTAMPLNPNGKMDRGRLAELLAARLEDEEHV